MTKQYRVENPWQDEKHQWLTALIVGVDAWWEVSKNCNMIGEMVDDILRLGYLNLSCVFENFVAVHLSEAFEGMICQWNSPF